MRRDPNAPNPAALNFALSIFLFSGVLGAVQLWRGRNVGGDVLALWAAMAVIGVGGAVAILVLRSRFTKRQ